MGAGACQMSMPGPSQGKGGPLGGHSGVSSFRVASVLPCHKQSRSYSIGVRVPGSLATKGGESSIGMRRPGVRTMGVRRAVVGVGGWGAGVSGGAATAGGLSGPTARPTSAAGHTHAPKVPSPRQVCDPTGTPTHGHSTTRPGTHAAGSSPRLPQPADATNPAKASDRTIPLMSIGFLACCALRSSGYRLRRGDAAR